MNKFRVLNAFERYDEGDVVFMNDRQAKYLLLNGLVEPVSKEKEPAPEPTKKIKEAN